MSESDLPAIVHDTDLIYPRKDFALRYATEQGTKDEEWAQVFGVTSRTIRAWKKDPAVARLIDAIRNDRAERMLSLAQSIEEKTLRRLDELLS